MFKRHLNSLVRKISDKVKSRKQQEGAGQTSTPDDDFNQPHTFENSFSNYDEAASFAKRLAVQGVPHTITRYGSAFMVEIRSGEGHRKSSTGATAGSSEQTYLELAELKTKFGMIDMELASERDCSKFRQEENQKLQAKIRSLEANIKELNDKEKKTTELINTLNQRTRSLVDSFEDRVHSDVNSIVLKKEEILREQELTLKHKTKGMEAAAAELESAVQRIKLLEGAYAQHFGHARIKEVAESVERRAICSRCNGSGGYNNSCPKCDGTGWSYIDEVVMKKVVELDALDTEKIFPNEPSS